MNKRIQWALLCLLLGVAGSQALGQGCVAIRQMGSSGSNNHNSSPLTTGQLQVFTSYRYFESFRHFRGSEEETHRVEEGTEVINTVNSMDLGATYMFSDRLALTMIVPITDYSRSSLYEHYGNSPTRNPDQMRFNTGSSGIGDIRITPSYSVLNSAVFEGIADLRIGVGIKIPTGDSDIEGDFHRLDENGEDYTITRPVDQSIQLGDGTWGYTLEVQGYRRLYKATALYFNGFYLFNPSETNDTLTRGTAEGVNPLIAYHSAADQFALRLGVDTPLHYKWGIIGSLGGQIEGVPSKDVFGGSEGYRRPGYVVSVEPGITVPYAHVNFQLSVPIAVYRNRVKSTYDLSDPTGERHGDAAFADYLINFTVGYRF